MRPPDAKTTNPAILAIVEAYISTPPPPHRDPTAPPVPYRTTEIDRARRDYLNAFFDGFTSPGNQTMTSNDARYYGFLAGQDFRSRNLAPEEEVMRSFGFEPVAVRGQVFFERLSALGLEFSPMENPGVRWEIDLLHKEGWPARNELKNGLEVVLRGYLSSDRYYGSRWMGDRKIFVIKTEVLTH